LKNLCIFHHFEKSLHFSPLWKIFMLFTWAGCPLQQDHFKKFLYFSPLWKISVFFTSLKNLCIFHLGRSPITIRPPQKTFFFNFLWVGHPWQFDHFKIFEFSKEKSSSFYFECTFYPSKGFIIS
jgi:hypothetical protein